MRIDYNELEHTIIPNFKGGKGQMNGQMFVDKAGKILTGRLTPNDTIGLHTHETNYEIIYVLEGKGVAIVDGVEEQLYPGVCSYCPQGSSHEVICTGPEDLFFFAVVPEV